MADEEKPVEEPQELDYVKDIQNKDTREILEEKPPEPKEEAPVEEKPVMEEPKQPSVSEVAEEAARKVLEEQRVQEEAKKEPEPTEQEKVYTEWQEKFTKENSRPPTYLEAMEFVEERAVEKIEARQKAKEVEAQEVINQQQKAQEDERKRINTFVDDEMADLYAAGKLTKIVDPNNPSDQGVVERKALFEAWQEVNTKRRAEGKPEIISATRIHEFYYKKPSAQPAGQDAPIAGAQNSGVPPVGEEMDYREIHNKPFSWFRKR